MRLGIVLIFWAVAGSIGAAVGSVVLDTVVGAFRSAQRPGEPVVSVHGSPPLVRAYYRPWTPADEDWYTRSQMLELRRALRGWTRSPGVALATVVSLALVIGANTAIFSLWNTVSLRTLITPAPQELAAVEVVDQAGNRGGLPFARFQQLRDRQTSFSAMFAYDDSALRTLEAEGTVFPGAALYVDDGFAAVMRLRPAIGRSLVAGDGAVAVIGYDTWQRYYQGSASALGRTIRMQEKALTIVGVAPEGFTTMENSGPVEAIVPLAAMGAGTSSWSVVGRLKPGVTIARAQSELDAVWAQVRRVPTVRIAVTPAGHGTGFNFARERYSYPLRVLLGMAALLLLLGSLNVATLLAARADARRREIGIQLALGAGRGRILREHWVESLALAAAGALAGVACARWAVGYFSQFVWITNVERARYVPLDGRVLAFTAGAAALSGAVFGLLPAIRALRTDAAESLRSGAAGGAKLGTARVLIVCQVALSVVLLVAAALFTSTLRRLESTPLGFDGQRVAGFALMNRAGGYRAMDPFAYYPDLFRRVSQVPGVEAVASATYPPLIPAIFPDTTVTAEEATAAVQESLVGPGYFETLGVPVVAGREFTFHDDTHAPRAAVVSESLARRLFSGGGAVGGVVHVGGEAPRDVVVVGVVRDSRLGSLQRPNPLQLFTSRYQAQYGGRQPYLLVRFAGGVSAGGIAGVRAAVEGLGREYPLRIETIGRAAERALAQERLMASLAAVFGVLALLLAAVGLYGLMSYAVTRRSREIGIRMAIGARPGTVARMVVRDALVLLAAGVAVGLPGVWAGSKAVKEAPLDGAAVGSAVVVLTLAAVVAAWLPARRAARVDPATALRSE
jgi:predicted permease